MFVLTWVLWATVEERPIEKERATLLIRGRLHCLDKGSEIAIHIYIYEIDYTEYQQYYSHRI